MSHPSVQPKLGRPNYMQLRRHYEDLRRNAHTSAYVAAMDDAILGLDRMWDAACMIADSMNDHYLAAVAELEEIEHLDDRDDDK